MKAKICHSSKKNLLVVTLIVCVLAPMLLANSVRAEGGPIWSDWTGPTYKLGNSQPYVAGFMSTEENFLYSAKGPDARAVRVTVSFSGTDKSVIQVDNSLAAGLACQGPSSEPARDYAYSLLLVLDANRSNPYVEGLVWKCVEYGNLDLASRTCIFNPTVTMDLGIS